MKLFRKKTLPDKDAGDDVLGTTNSEDRYSQTGSPSQQRGRSRTFRPKNSPNNPDPTNRRYEHDAAPMLQRVPTARDYDSEDSDEDMVEERSRFSRYDIERNDDGGKQNKLEADEDEGSFDPDDRYSHYGPPVERIGSEEEDDSLPAQWKSWSVDGDDDEQESNMGSKNPSKNSSKKKNSPNKNLEKEETVSLKEDGDEDEETKEEGSPRDLIPAVMSDTSSLTDPVVREAQVTKMYRAQQKALKSAEKMKRIKQEQKSLTPSNEDHYATQATETSVDQRKSKETASTKDRRESKEVASTKDRRVSKGEASAKRESKEKDSTKERREKLTSKKGYFQRKRQAAEKVNQLLSSTSKDSKDKEGKETAKKKLQAARKKSKEVKPTDEPMTREATRNMYSKSLLTDVSEGLNTKEPDDESQDDEGSFDHDLPYVGSIRIKRKPSNVEKSREAAVMELDEYSVASQPSNPYDDPQLVQCLKFYYCGGAAAVIDSGIRTATCRYPLNTVTELPMDEIEAARIRDENTMLSPRPNVEIVLEGYRLDGAPREGRDDDDDDSVLLDEAPNIQLPHARSYVKEVTSLHLQLDEVLDEQRSPAANMHWDDDDESERGQISITTIEVPVASEDNSDGDDASEPIAMSATNDSETNGSEQTGTLIMIKKEPAKRKGLKGMFSRFRKQKGVSTDSTSPTLDEASNGPIEVAVE
jgi:hypothetical protein